MFTMSRVKSVEYYLASNDADARDSGSYYLDNGAEEDKGVWWSNQPKAYRSENEEKSVNIPFVNRNADVNPRDFRDLANGQDPISKERLRQTQKKNQSVAYDMQFACPKSVSLLHAFAPDDETKKAIEQIQRESMFEALDYLSKNGFVDTRRGKGGKVVESPAEICCATFLHTTSRSGDPQLHGHAVMPNVCRRKDGTTGTIDNATVLQHQAEMGAIYRIALARKLEERLGVKCVKDGRNFRVEGVPQSLEEVFSKRRNKIEEVAKERGIDVSHNRQSADFITLETRDKKTNLPNRNDLEKKWDRELHQNGWSKESFWENVVLSNEHRTEEKYDLKEIGKNAINELQANESALEERKLNAFILESLQGICSLDDALKTIEELKKDGTVLEVGRNENGPVFATPEMIESERSLLRDAIERKNEREFVSQSKIDEVIATRPTMSEEQAEAVRHALNNDGVSAIEGSAGTGKSFSLGTVAECARDVGFRVHVIAPSHKAKDVLKADTNSGDDDTQTVRGFLNRITNPEHKEFIQLSEDDAIILDEAGMVGTEEMSDLLRTAREAGAKVILAGDTRQLQPVGAGAPMSAIADTCGTQRITKIRRQKVEWQREASEAFASGDTRKALEAYEENGRIKGGTKDEAIAELMKDWRKDVEENPEGTRVVLATRNADVKLLNEALREQACEAGIISGEDVTVQAMTRGRNGHVASLQIAKGDRLIFGETVALEGHQINNSDQATVVSVISEEGKEPVVTLELDKGGTVTAPWSAFARKPAPGEEPGPVKCQHAYAVTVHASQGMTVDKGFVLNSEGMGQESAYVAMTRHRFDATMYVNTARMEDRIANRNSDASFGIYKDGRTVSDEDKEEQENLRNEVPRSEVMNMLYSECSKKELKINISDFVENKTEWAGVAHVKKEVQTVSGDVQVLEKEPEAMTSEKVKEIEKKAETELARIVEESRKEQEKQREHKKPGRPGISI